MFNYGFHVTVGDQDWFTNVSFNVSSRYEYNCQPQNEKKIQIHSLATTNRKTNVSFDEQNIDILILIQIFQSSELVYILPCEFNTQVSVQYWRQGI